MKHILKAVLTATATGIIILVFFETATSVNFFESYARTIYFVSMMVTIFAGISMKKVLAYQTQAKINYTPKFYELKISVLGFLVMFLLFASPIFDDYEKYRLCNCEWIRWISCFFMVDAIALFTWSSWTFGKTFFNSSGKPVPLKLVRTGPYSVIRHPLYLGFIAWAFATVFVYNNFIALFLAIIFTWMIVLRASDEEIFLELEFGEEWLIYKKNTYRFIPLIY